MKIKIPHLNYTVYTKLVNKIPPEIEGAVLYAERNDKRTATIYLHRKNPSPGDVAHELIHVLQFICQDRYIDFVQEKEHMAYLMHFLMGKILGYHYENK